MRISDLVIQKVTRRAPDIQIGGAQNPYLNRWYIIPRNKFLNIYLHQFMRDDDDRAFHDHPWWSLSWCMRGCMAEHNFNGGRNIYEGDWTIRSATFAHRLVIPDGRAGKVWTLFFTGPRVREWGFHCQNKWVHWRDFTSGANGETVGRGCD